MTDRRRALLIAALAAVRVKSRAPELVMLHAWLDSWSGLGAIVVGMQRHGYDLSLTHDRNGWRATFLHRSHVLHPWVGQVLHWFGRLPGAPLTRQPQAKGAETMVICPLWAFDRRVPI